MNNNTTTENSGSRTNTIKDSTYADFSVVEKQEYLRNNIIDQNYDAEAFALSMKNEKLDGSKLENWNMDEQIDLVDRFKKNDSKVLTISQVSKNESIQLKKDASNNDGATFNQTIFDSYMPNEHEIKEAHSNKIHNAHTIYKPDINEILNNVAKYMFVSSHQAAKYEDFILHKTPKDLAKYMFKLKEETVGHHNYSKLNKTINVTKNSVSKLHEVDEINVSILGTNKVKASMFKKDYTTYKIRTENQGWQVERRFDDFYWLRERLQQQYPLSHVPTIPKKKQNHNFENQTIQKRKTELDFFLKAIALHPELRSTIEFEQFQSQHDQKLWEKVRIKETKEMYNNSNAFNLRDKYKKMLFDMPNPLCIKDFPHLNEKVELNQGADFQDFTIHLAELLNTSETLFKEQGRLSKSLVGLFDQASEIISSMSEKFSKLNSQMHKFNESVKIGKAYELEDMYKNLDESFNLWGNNFKTKLTILQNNVVRQFKNSKKEVRHFKDLKSLAGKMQHDYETEFRETEKKKEKLFNHSKDLSSWDVHPHEVSGISPEKLFSDQDTAKIFIQPKLTQKLKNMRQVVGYANTKLLTEWNQFKYSKTKSQAYSQANYGECMGLMAENELSTFGQLMKSMILIEPRQTFPDKECYSSVLA